MGFIRSGRVLNALPARGWFELRRGILFAMLTIASGGPIAAQQTLLPVFHFNHLTTADGLPTNNIFGVVRDSKGFVWVGTGDGLARHDGYSFETYRNVPNDSTSLSSSMTMMGIVLES